MKEEKVTRQPDLSAIIESLDLYKEKLYSSKKISPTAFKHMEMAIYSCKCIIQDHFGSARKKEDAMVK